MQTPPEDSLLSAMPFGIAILYALTFVVLFRSWMCPAILTLVRLMAHPQGTDVIAMQQ